MGRYDAQKVTDLAIAELPGDVKSALVSEAGASVYSVSPLAQKEYPGLSLTCWLACTRSDGSCRVLQRKRSHSEEPSPSRSVWWTRSANW